jgi:hypothetical protein
METKRNIIVTVSGSKPLMKGYIKQNDKKQEHKGLIIGDSHAKEGAATVKVIFKRSLQYRV